MSPCVHTHSPRALDAVHDPGASPLTRTLVPGSGSGRGIQRCYAQRIQTHSETDENKLLLIRSRVEGSASLCTPSISQTARITPPLDPRLMPQLCLSFNENVLKLNLKITRCPFPCTYSHIPCVTDTPIFARIQNSPLTSDA